MDTDTLQSLLKTVLESLIDARDEIEGDDDDIELAEVTRELVAETEEITSVATYDELMVLTANEGLVVRTADGAEFQITIVQSCDGRE